ncbi:MAG: hypothetical protein HDR72_00715 [Ruminococcaceae bacterium]|nr:hypothetical protein [Oscillospiraceae bacterium]
MTFDEMLKQALDETADERAAQMLNVEKKHRFSLAYRLWERKILRDLRRNNGHKPLTMRKAKYALTAMIAASSLLLGVTAYAAIAAIGRFYFDEPSDSKPNYSQLFIENHPSDKTTIEEYYGLDQDSGWSMDYSMAGAYTTLLYYWKGDRVISFSQNIIADSSYIYTGNSPIEPVSLYEEDDGFFIDYQDGCVALYWIFDGYFFRMYGKLTKTEAIDLARSTRFIYLRENH